MQYLETLMLMMGAFLLVSSMVFFGYRVANKIKEEKSGEKTPPDSDQN